MADDVYYCSNCGGVMVFDINTQMLKCPNCDATIQIVGNQDRIIEHRFRRRLQKQSSARAAEPWWR